MESISVKFTEGYSPATEFHVTLTEEPNGAVVSINALHLVRQIAALAIGHHEFLFVALQRAIGGAAENPMREAYDRGVEAERERVRALLEPLK